jgi:hypothetical protein
MANRQQTPDKQQPKDRRGPVTTTPDDDEAQGTDQTRAGEQNDPQQARQRRDQNPDLDQEQVTQVEDEEGEEDEDEETGRGN